MLPKHKKRTQPTIKLPAVDVNQLKMYYSQGNSQMTIFSLDLSIDITRIKKVFQNAKRPSQKDDDARSAKDRFPELQLSINSDKYVVVAEHKFNGNIGDLLKQLLNKLLLKEDTLPMVEDSVLEQVQVIKSKFPNVSTIDVMRCILNNDTERLENFKQGLMKSYGQLEENQTNNSDQTSQNISPISTMCTIYAEPQVGVIIKPNLCTIDDVMTELSDKFDLIENLFLVHHDPKQDSISLVYNGPQELNAIDTFLMYFSPNKSNFFIVSKNQVNTASLSQPMAMFAHDPSEIANTRGQNRGQIKRAPDQNSEAEENLLIKKNRGG